MIMFCFVGSLESEKIQQQQQQQQQQQPSDEVICSYDP
jgi:hypothetical protein